MTTKTILAGCVGSFLALSGAQAASPVQYVKICSLYGPGFYYIPGTDMCIKVGGYVRSQTEYQSINGLALGSTNGVNTPTTTTGGIFGPSTIDDGGFTRGTNSTYFGTRGTISVDARNQSEYGTIRSYIRIGLGTNSNLSNPANQFFADRAFVQFAGFTAGLTQSFFDVFSNTELFSYSNAKTSGDTKNYGIPVVGYTAQFGNGFSASIAAEIPHYPAGVVDGFVGGAFAANGVVVTDTAGLNMPDIIGNLRVDQSWGYAAISGAMHRVAGQYYGTPNLPGNGHPDDKYGWAIQAGGLMNLPGGDSIGASFVGTKGAIGYATKAGSWQVYNGNSAGIGWVTDGIFDGTATSANNQIHLTNAWSVNAGYEHKWNERWKSSLYGGYTKIWYDGDTVDLINTHLPGAAGTMPCGVPVAGSVWPPVNIPVGSGNSCSPNFSFWQVGSRTQWDITRATSLGLDVFYTYLNTAYKGSSPGLYSATTGHAAVDNVSNLGTLSGILRVQHNFEP
jgi:hypothetical protein